MKTLTLHYNGSYHKFEGLYEKYWFEIKGDTVFYIYLLGCEEGTDSTHAVFKKWDYFLIESEEDF